MDRVEPQRNTWARQALLPTWMVSELAVLSVKLARLKEGKKKKYLTAPLLSEKAPADP